MLQLCDGLLLGICELYILMCVCMYDDCVVMCVVYAVALVIALIGQCHMQLMLHIHFTCGVWIVSHAVCCYFLCEFNGLVLCV